MLINDDTERESLMFVTATMEVEVLGSNTVVISPVVEATAGLVVMIDEDAVRGSVFVLSEETVREADFAVGMS